MTTFANHVPVLLLAATLVGLAPAAAQTHDPAPVRIAAEDYGSRSGGMTENNGLSLRLDGGKTGEPQIAVTGGQPGGIAFLFGGGRQASLPGPFQTVLLVHPDVIVPIGVLDASGAAQMPVDLVRKELIGGSVFLQALSLGGANASVWLSAGLAVRFAAGNAQPTLTYDGPPSTAVLVAQGPAAQRTHQVLHSVIAPTTGWTLVEVGRESNSGVTRIYVQLEAPGGNEIPMPVLETKRLAIPLGSQAEPVIELWIEQKRRGAGAPLVFRLAASLERDF